MERGSVIDAQITLRESIGVEYDRNTSFLFMGLIGTVKYRRDMVELHHGTREEFINARLNLIEEGGEIKKDLGLRLLPKPTRIFKT